MAIYPTVLTTGILISLLLIHPALFHPETETDSVLISVLFDRAILCILAGLISARLAFVLFHLPYYRVFPGEIFQIRLGGLDWAGAVAGVILSAGLLTRFNKTAFLLTLDHLSFPALIVTFSHALGCLLGNCMPGLPSTLFNFLPPSADWLGITQDRWPSAALLAIAASAALFLLQRFKMNSRGLRAALTLSLLSGINLLISFTLAPPSLMVGSYRLETVEAAAALIISTPAIGLLKRQDR